MQRPGTWKVELFISLSIAILLSGCRNAAYTPTTLPHQLAAPMPHSVHSVNLSRLSSVQSNSELLRPGDLVEVTIATGAEKTPPPKWKLRVADDAALNVPLVGIVSVAHLSPSDAEAQIRDAAIQRGVYIDPKVTLAIVEKKTIQVTVAGAVKEPSTFEIPAANADLLASITQAKGFEEDADTIIELRHPPGVGPQRMVQSPEGQVVPASAESAPQSHVTIDLTQINETPRSHLQVFDGTVVTVKRKKPRTVHVMGLVNDPGVIEMPDDEPLTLLSALSQAGDTRVPLADRVKVIRRGPSGSEAAIIDVSLREAKKGGPNNLKLAPGDIVSVEETPLTFAMETVRTFFRVGFSAAIPGL